jgi:hypothetical protein
VDVWHNIVGLPVFCPDGTIPICCYNVLSTVHDSNIASIGKIYDTLEDVYNRTGGGCTVDSTFASKNIIL